MATCLLRSSWHQSTRWTSVNNCRIAHIRNSLISQFRMKANWSWPRQPVWGIKKLPMDPLHLYNKTMVQNRSMWCCKTYRTWAMKAISGLEIHHSRFRLYSILDRRGPGCSLRLVVSKIRHAHLGRKGSFNRNRRTSELTLKEDKNLPTVKVMLWATPLKIKAASL